MGSDLVGAALAQFPGVSGNAFKVLVRMAHTALDKPGKKGEPPRLYWGGWESLALALGHDVPASADDEATKRRRKKLRQYVGRAITELEKTGAIKRKVEHPQTGTQQVYELVLQPVVVEPVLGALAPIPADIQGQRPDGGMSVISPTSPGGPDESDSGASIGGPAGPSIGGPEDPKSGSGGSQYWGPLGVIEDLKRTASEDTHQSPGAQPQDAREVASDNDSSSRAEDEAVQRPSRASEARAALAGSGATFVAPAAVLDKNDDRCARPGHGWHPDGICPLDKNDGDPVQPGDDLDGAVQLLIGTFDGHVITEEVAS